MATQWLFTDKTSGKGDGQITLSSQPWFSDLKKQTATVKISGLYTNTYITATRDGVTPIVTIEGGKIDFTSLAGTATFKITTNVSLMIEESELPEWITLNDYYYDGYTSELTTYTITATVSPNKGEARSCKLRLKHYKYDEFNFGEIYITQSAFSYDEWGYAELIYETDEDNQTIGLFGTGGGESYKSGSYLKHYSPSTSESRKTSLVSEIIIDGVVQDWGTDDSFLIEKAGEHTVYVLFRNNTIEVNESTGASGMVGGSMSIHHQHPFWGNLNLKRAILPSTLSYGGNDSLFRGCPRLESIEINNESCMCDYLAYDSAALETIKYPSTITRIPGYAFANNAANVSYKNFVTDNITAIGSYAFAYSNITGNITDSNITTIGQGAFSTCTSLDGAILDVRGITLNTDTFKNCTQYKEVIIDDASNKAAFANIEGVIYIHCSENYYPSCLKSSKFTKVVMDINPTVIESGSWFPNGCVEEIEFLNTTPNWYYDFGGANFGNYFQNTPTIKKITVHSMTAPLVYPETFGGIGLNGTLYYPAEADYSNWLADDKLGQYGWIGLPIGFSEENYIMYKTSNDAQYNPSRTVADANITKTLYDNSSKYFFMCFDGPITVIKENAFSDARITALVLPNTVTTLEDYIFSSSNITQFVVPDSVTTMDSDALFSTNKTLKKLTIGGGMTIVDGGYWDTMLKNLEELTLREGVEQLTWNAYGLTKLTKVSLPSTLTVLGNDCFDGANALDVSTVFHKDLNITTIGSESFNGTKATGPLVLPSTLTSIGAGAFKNCEGLSEIYSYATVAPTTETDSFNFCYSGTLYYPAGSDYSGFLAKLNKSSSYKWVGQEMTE